LEKTTALIVSVVFSISIVEVAFSNRSCPWLFSLRLPSPHSFIILKIAMDIFGNLSFLGQRAYRELMAARRAEQQQEQQRDPPPAPASSKAVRQLPTVVVTPEDLVDPNNRECCICLEK
jgi:hypothetical protein